MTQLVYDGSFDGLLTAVFEVYERKAAQARIVPDSRCRPELFSQDVRVFADAQKAARVWKGLRKRLSPQSLLNVYACFLSELPEADDVLLAFFRQVFSSVQPIEYNYGSLAVLRIAQISKQVFREKHRMEAFVRFEQLQDGTFYAVIAPDFNVLPLITPHFTSRYADQTWIIYDNQRKYGVYYDQQMVREIRFETSPVNKHGDAPPQLFHPTEDSYQHLWQAYFKHANIPERRNLKLHLRQMPVRYWKYLTEKQPVER